TLASTEILAFSNGVVEAAEALIGVFPAALTLMAQGIATLALAFQSNSELVQVMKGTWEEMAGAWAEASSSVLPGLNNALNELNTLTPLVANGLAHTGDVLGYVAEQAAHAMTTPIFKQDLANIMDNNATS